MTADEMPYHAAIAGIYLRAAPASGTPPVHVNVTGDDMASFQPQPKPQPPIEEFDWFDKKTTRDFVRLEQKVLAKVADPNEISRYRMMKQNRNSKVFAERQLRDYEEIRRLKKLSEKILELQQYLRQIDL